MTAMTPSQAALNDASAMLDVMIRGHQAAAIPAVIAACVSWAVENGGADLMQGTLSRAVAMTAEADRIHRSLAQ